MNYEPEELKKVTFSKALFCGYSQYQVDKLIGKVYEDYHMYEEEIRVLNNNMELLEEKVQHYRTIEEALQHTLLIAQHTSDTIKKNAMDKAATIIREAEVQADSIINEANEEVVRIRQNYEAIKRSLSTYRAKTESLIHSQLDILAIPIDEGIEKTT